jgi:hypothetical protein
MFLDLNFVALLLLFAGFVIGLGAVTVIDLHGFFGRKSSYWTVATTRTHKITKPLIWIGTVLALIGGILLYRGVPINTLMLLQIISVPIMILNGVFLSFSVSPYLLSREREGKDAELLPQSWQNKITFSFIISVICWWGNLVIFAYFISQNIWLL